MSTFLILVGFLGVIFGVFSLTYTFFSKKIRLKKKIGIGILAAFIIMIVGGTLAPPIQADVNKKTNDSSSSISASSDSREKDVKKDKEEVKKKKIGEKKAKEKTKKEQKAKKKQKEKQKTSETKKKQKERQKAKEAKKKQKERQKAKEAKKKQKKEAKLKADQEEKKQEEIRQKTSTAKTILAQAEAEPTRDNYNAALSAIQSIPEENQELLNRLASVDSTIKSNEAAEAERQKQQAEAQRQAQEQQATQQTNSYTADGQWSVATNGMVFARSDSGKYYSRVTNPNNYQYMSQIDADNAGYSRATRGNQYARP
ncbi:hypothetical protein [Enterococcus durans]|uniref:hypothetical protein n=1 Tax=Enterococcus durans TaxID=53345 RepID=UPI0009BE7890|nr:hypothetical protein [Enterococcus durans]ASV96274.1 hypothetical protein CJZ72_12365 [Enterococcus durans]MBX9041190.1 hypothetical protein [Enterococcus durans]MBX9077907.1 hypothetical protein [Enterococcus durans]MCB8506611.1 hypothetical protein [Enterococcus durans]MDT2773950.1 hypothetical protein [Enterococcus durans]